VFGLVQVESKLFYFDLKENSRGSYLKIAEKGTNRDRSTVIVPAAGIRWFVQLLHYYAGGIPDTGELVGKELPIETKVFYFEIGQNPRGRFLRVSESGAGPRGRSSIIIPAGGAGAVSAWALFRDTLARVEAAHQQHTALQNLEPYGPRSAPAALSVEDIINSLGFEQLSVSGPQTVVGPGPAPPTLSEMTSGVRTVRVGHKRFYFSLGSNQKGQYMRITEVVGSDRISIIVPAESFHCFQEALEQTLQLHRSHVGMEGPPRGGRGG
jgi:hypothetical protein